MECAPPHSTPTARVNRPGGPAAASTMSESPPQADAEAERAEWAPAGTDSDASTASSGALTRRTMEAPRGEAAARESWSPTTMKTGPDRRSACGSIA